MNNIVEVNDLTCLKNDIAIIDHVSFSIKKGEVVGIVGAEGSGKSALLRCITGLINNDGGQVLINGHNINDKRNVALQGVGIAIDPPKFYGYLSAYQNLKIVSNVHKHIDKQRIYEVLSLVGLRSRATEKTKKFPYSIKKKLSLAQALLPRPNLMILDEPFKSLKNEEQKRFLAMLTDIARKEEITVIITGKDVEDLTNFCNRFIVLENGRITNDFDSNHVRKFGSLKEYKFIKVSHPNFAGKLTIQNFGLMVKLNNDRLIMETDDETVAKIIKLLTEKKISVYSAGQVKCKLEKMVIEQKKNLSTESEN